MEKKEVTKQEEAVKSVKEVAAVKVKTRDVIFKQVFAPGKNPFKQEKK